jgi:hypothetical protein
VHITIKADELAGFRASNPGLKLSGLLDVTFEFNDQCEICNCHGTVAGTTSAKLIGPGLVALADIAKRRFIKKLRNLDRKPQDSAVILPFRKAVAA